MRFFPVHRGSTLLLWLGLAVAPLASAEPASAPTAQTQPAASALSSAAPSPSSQPELTPSLPPTATAQAEPLAAPTAQTQSAAPVPATPVLPPSSQVELAQSLPTTMEEIAAMDVLRELCPSLLPTQQHAAFRKGLTIALKQMMPGLSNPLLALDSLQSDAGYQELYRQARADASAATAADNRQICQDILSYNKKH